MRCSIMKSLLSLILVLFCGSLYATEVSKSVDKDLNTSIRITCSSGDKSCESECKSNTCEFEEAFCSSCAGTDKNLSLMFLFYSLGVDYYRGDKILDSASVTVQLLKSELILIDYTTVYNYFDEFKSLEVKKKFLSVCPVNSVSSFVMAKRSFAGEMGDFKYLYCYSESGHGSYYKLDNLSGK